MGNNFSNLCSLLFPLSAALELIQKGSQQAIHVCTAPLQSTCVMVLEAAAVGAHNLV